ncbi:hypothetical protein [uncultured Erythrobacter sp.]|uniref:hypothetical protein n=1 Tax=uncultured Erythrobacter sp. TaxID=263913 RepID=UPI0026346312|nr:hypothetical protein [uncultured Erythrobacter sp.]
MLFRIFRLPPIVYFVLAPALLALGIVMYVYENGRDAERTAALSHDAPAMIELAEITSAETGNDFNEVTVRAQVDPLNMIELVKTRRGRERGRKLFAPLYPADAADFSAPATAILEIDGRVSDDELGQFYLEDGASGPVLVLNGVLESSFNSDAREALENSVALADGFYTIKPFVNGREVDLKPSGNASIFVIFGLILAALLGGYGFLRKRYLDKQRAEEEAYYEAGDA